MTPWSLIPMIPYSPELRRLRGFDRASPQFNEQLSNFLRRNEYRSALMNLRSEDLAWLTGYLDSVLNSIPDRANPAFRESLDELRKIAGVGEVLPISCTLSESLLGCVYEGTFNGSKVRIRRVRMYRGGDPKKAKETFHQVAVMSKHLSHPNIVPLLGATVDPFELISDLMPGGDLMEYITNHPDVDRHSLLSDVAEGLTYLHLHNVIHGDLKGSNILVDATGRARITDFGLAMITQDLDSIRHAPAEGSHGTRWIAPEILNGQGAHSKRADVFSFAGVVIEVFTGSVPFGKNPPYVALLAIMRGERPSRPTNPTLTDNLWELIQRCWDKEAHLRPHALRIACSFGIPAWKRLIDRPLSLEERVSLIADIFSDSHETEIVRNLRGDAAQSFVDIADKTLDNLAPRLQRRCLNASRRICSHQGLLPRSVQIPLCYNRLDSPLYRGGYADIWKGNHQGRPVAIKVLRVYLTSDFGKIASRFCKEVIAWKALRHRNVLPLLGVTMDNSLSLFAMASEWMVNGNINEFIKANRDANRSELLEGVARGLIYLHDREMIHGDLKGANILVDETGNVRLADFGLLTLVSDTTNSTVSLTGAGTTRWMSPELLNPEQFGFQDGRPTKGSDCYALGMVILEVLSGQVPFAHHKDLVVIQKVTGGERPERPEGPWFTDDLWRTLERCWSPQPINRPTIESVLEYLEPLSAAWRPRPPSEIEDIRLKPGNKSRSTVTYYSSIKSYPTEAYNPHHHSTLDQYQRGRASPPIQSKLAPLGRTKRIIPTRPGGSKIPAKVQEGWGKVMPEVPDDQHPYLPRNPPDYSRFKKLPSRPKRSRTEYPETVSESSDDLWRDVSLEDLNSEPAQEWTTVHRTKGLLKLAATSSADDLEKLSPEVEI